MAKREYEDVDGKSLFSTEDYPNVPFREYRRRHFITRWAGGLIGFVLVSVLIGGLVAVIPLGAVSGSAMAAAPVVDMFKKLPEKLPEVAIGQRNTMYDVNGKPFAEVYTEDRVAVKSLDQISKYARQGLIDTEDKNFYEHGSIDLIGTTRAALSGSGGGSGITQQLVKNLQFYDMAGKSKKGAAVEQSLSRKVRELKLAMGYEKDHSKDEILLAYFNTVAFGGPNTYSIESAARYFFNTSAKNLTLAQSAALVGSVNNPVMYDLGNDKAKSAWKMRQKVVLGRMVAEGHITQKQADAAYKQPLKLYRQKSASGNCTSSAYPFYCQYVLDQLRSSPKLGETQAERDAIIAKGGLRIKTYMDPAVMGDIDTSLKEQFGTNNRAVAPIAIVAPGSGGVTGIGVNRDYGTGPGKTTINVPANPAATGSTYKMFTLAAALENGFDENSLAFSSQCPLMPQGYDYPAGGFSNSVSCGLQGGFLNYKQATAYSSNTWYITLAMKVGMDKLFDMSKKLNLSVPDYVNERSLSFVIGSVENSPINMAAAYATFANGGVFCPATPVASYSYADGSTPSIPDNYDPASESCRRVMSPHTASVVLKAMRANTYGEVPGAFGVDARIKGQDAVGKSGTNQTYNYEWGQVSKNYSLFSNVYDMDQVSRGVYRTVLYKGAYSLYNLAQLSGSEVLKTVLTGKKNSPLDFNSTDLSLPPVPVSTREFFTVPSVLGMEPESALATLRATGIEANVLKVRKPASAQYPVGVIIEQSLEAGTSLPVGTKKTITITESR